MPRSAGSPARADTATASTPTTAKPAARICPSLRRLGEFSLGLDDDGRRRRGHRLRIVRGLSLNGPIMQTNIVTPQDTVSHFSSSVDENTNGDSATQPPTTAAATRKRLSDSAASDNSVAKVPAMIAFAVWVARTVRQPPASGARRQSRLQRSVKAFETS